MAQINDAKKATLTNLGYTGPIDEAYHNYLAAETGSDLDATQDLEKLLFTTLGYTGSLYDMWFEFLRDNGFTNSLQDMLYAFWNSDDAGLSPLHFSEFYSPLEYTAVPTRAAAGTTATFTRATTSTWQNNDGYLVTGLAGEIGFPGARRVYNRLPSSENLTVGWTGTGSTLAAGSITETGAVSGHYAQTTSMVVPTNAVFIMQAEIKQSVGTRNIGIGTNSVGNAIFNPSTGVFVANDGVTLDHGTGAQTADGYWPVWVKVQAATSNKPIISLYSGTTQSYAGDGASQVLVRKLQVEDVTAQTTQTAGEYVSVGAESAPYYHGSFVDGVKCFPTDLAGNPLTTMLGYNAEGARTNLCRYSQSIAAGFTFTGTCTGTDNVGIYAGVPFTRINTATGGASYITCSYTGDGTKAFSVLLKKDAAVTGTYSVGFYDQTAAAVRGYVTATIASDGSMTFAAFSGCAVTSSELLADGVYLLKGTVSGIVAANTNFYYANFAVGTATSCLVSAMQTEDASVASSYIATTTTAVTRNADVLTYSGGDVPNLKTLCATFDQPVATSAPAAVVSLDNGGSQWAYWHYLGTGTDVNNSIRFQGYNGAVQWQQDVSQTQGATTKAAISIAANDIKMSLDGATVTQDVSAAVPSFDRLSVGHLGGSFQPNANVGGIYGWTRNLSQSEVNAVAT